MIYGIDAENTPPLGIEPRSPKGTGLKPVAIPLCDGGFYHCHHNVQKILDFLTSQDQRSFRTMAA